MVKGVGVGLGIVVALPGFWVSVGGRGVDEGLGVSVGLIVVVGVLVGLVVTKTGVAAWVGEALTSAT